MSAPANKEALDKLQKAVDANMAAGDWVSGATLPGSVELISEDRPADVVVKQVGSHRLLKRGK